MKDIRILGKTVNDEIDIALWRENIVLNRKCRWQFSSFNL